jgi:ethanolamine utilization protein EutP (predicted NTPase)
MTAKLYFSVSITANSSLELLHSWCGNTHLINHVERYVTPENVQVVIFQNVMALDTRQHLLDHPWYHCWATVKQIRRHDSCIYITTPKKPMQIATHVYAATLVHKVPGYVHIFFSPNSVSELYGQSL